MGVDGGNKNLAAMMSKIDNMDRRITKMDQSIHAIQVGCDKYNGVHLSKDCSLDENENRKAQVCYSSGDKYDEDWRKPKKKWLPYDEYKKAKEEKFWQTCHGFYQKEQSEPEKKIDFESWVARFVGASEKRHDAIDSTLRKQKASILNIETQVGKLSKCSQAITT